MSVRNALLGLIAQRPRHGYELHAALEAVMGVGGVWEVKPAQIYTTLSRLEESGLVHQSAVGQSGGPEKRIFAITTEGMVALEEWFAQPADPEHQRDEFSVKLLIALLTGESNLYRVLQVQRIRLFQDLHDITTRRNRSDPHTELAQILLLEKTAMHLEADLRWLDMVEARLDEMKRQPLPEPESRPRGRPPRISRG